MSNENNRCQNCKVLYKQCEELRNEINQLTLRLDTIVYSIFHDVRTVATQTDTIHNTAIASQTDVSNNTSISECQTDMLFDLFCTAGQQIQLGENEINNNVLDSEGSVEPLLLYPNHPFDSFSMEDLDKETLYSHILENRCLAYYGVYSYKYGNVHHLPNPIPQGNYHINKIIEHVIATMPNLAFNSVLITKFRNGNDCLQYHSDNEAEICPNSSIVTISLGETRTIKFRSSDGSGSEQSVSLKHGDLYKMSKISQNSYQHCIPRDYSKLPRISITLRNLIPHADDISTQEVEHNTPARNYQKRNNGNGFEAPTTDGYQANYPPRHPSQNKPVISDRNKDTVPISTVCISSSMFRHLDPNKLSSKHKRVEVLFFPGATAGDMLKRLQNNKTFSSINPVDIKNIFLMTGTNNVDRILNDQNNTQFQKAIGDIKQLTEFLHHWASSATVNVINILPRTNPVRNEVINHLNYFIYDLCEKTSYMKFKNTESAPCYIFSTKFGIRKNNYFKNGLDNVHLNSLGVMKLGKYLKFHAHHPDD